MIPSTARTDDGLRAVRGTPTRDELAAALAALTEPRAPEADRYERWRAGRRRVTRPATIDPYGAG